LDDTSTHRHAEPVSSPVASLLFLTSLFFLNFISRIVLAPLLPIVERDLGVSHIEAGSLFLLISLGYFVSLLCSGFLSSKITHRHTIITSATAVGISLLAISFSSSLWAIRIGLILLGGSAGIYLPSGIATLTSLIKQRHWGKALAVHEVAPNLSFVAAPLISEVLLLWFTWRSVLAILGGTSLLLGMAYATFSRGGEFRGQAPSLATFKPIMSEPAFWILIVLFSLAIGSTLGIFTMLPLYLVVERGLGQSWANTLIGLSRILGVGTAFIGGWITDRLGPRSTMGFVFLITGMLTIMLGLVPGSWLVVAVFLQPMFAVCFFPAGFAALSRIGPPEARNVAVSLTVPIAFVIGAGAIPTGIGYMGDAGSFALGIVLAGGIILMGALLSTFVKIRNNSKI
jgi:NNP family nitrate/nitrite transporter-like MFS transporter